MNGIKKEVIENYMKENNLSKTAFCKECKICIGSFNKIMTGQNFRLGVLFKISNATNIKLANFFNSNRLRD